MEKMDKDNIRLVESNEYYKAGAGNSLKFQPSSKKQVTSRYISYLKDALKDAQDEKNNIASENIDEEKKKQKEVDYSKYIEELQDEIIFLERDNRVIDGDKRALKLPKAGEPILENVEGIYKTLDSKYEQISVSKVAEENKSEVTLGIDNAIEEKSMGKLFDEFATDTLAEVQASEEEKEEVTNDISDPVIVPSFTSNSEMIDEIKEIVDEQEKVENSAEPIKENSLKEFKPKTEEEVTEYRNNAMEDAFKIFNSDESKEEAIRDTVVVIPERDENKEEKEVEEYITVEKEQEEKPEARSMIVPVELIEKARELTKSLREEEKKAEELDIENSSVETDIENQRKLNSEVVAKEEEAKKALEKATAEAIQEKQKYESTISQLEQKLVDVKNQNDAKLNGIQVKKAELSSIKEDTENRNREIENLDKENKSKQTEIANYRQLQEMLIVDNDDSFGEKTR